MRRAMGLIGVAVIGGNDTMPAPLMRLLPDLSANDRTDLRYYCGFGCVRCGVTIYEYLSLPPVEGRKRNEGDLGATLLCPPCHQLVENERLTVSQVHGFHASPISRQRNFARDRLPFWSGLPDLIVGGSRGVRDTAVPLTIRDEPLLAFSPPMRGVGATRISVRLGDVAGNPVQIIRGNEWLITDGSWNFVQRGDRYVIAATKGEGLAVLRIVTRSRIAVEHLRTTIYDRKVEVTQDWIEIDGRRRVDSVGSGMLIGLEL